MQVQRGEECIEVQQRGEKHTEGGMGMEMSQGNGKHVKTVENWETKCWKCRKSQRKKEIMFSQAFSSVLLWEV